MKRCMICGHVAEHEIDVGIRGNERPHKVLALCREHALDMVIEIQELSTRWGLSCEVKPPILLPGCTSPGRYSSPGRTVSAP